LADFVSDYSVEPSTCQGREMEDQGHGESGVFTFFSDVPLSTSLIQLCESIKDG